MRCDSVLQIGMTLIPMRKYFAIEGKTFSTKVAEDHPIDNVPQMETRH